MEVDELPKENTDFDEDEDYDEDDDEDARITTHTVGGNKEVTPQSVR